MSNKLTAEEISDILMALTPNFQHTSSGQWTHLVLTGGEPMLCQNGLSDVLKTLAQRNNLPRFLTVETNGTQMPHHSLEETILHKYQTDEREWFWSTSP